MHSESPFWNVLHLSNMYAPKLTQTSAKLLSTVCVCVWLYSFLVCYLTNAANISAIDSDQSLESNDDSFELSVPLNTTNQTEFSDVARSSTDQLTPLNSTHLSTRVLAILKLLQLIHTIAAHRNQTLLNKDANDSSVSESRSLMSWFKLKKPSQRQENFYNFDRHPPQIQLEHISKKPRPPMYRHTMHQYGGMHNQHPYTYLPHLNEMSTIDYWLKFIENAKIDERTMPLAGRNKHTKAMNKRRPSPNYKRDKNLHGKVKTRPNEYTFVNSEKEDAQNGNNSDEEYDEDIPANNDITGDSKTVSQPKQTFEYATSPRCDKFTDDICIDDFEYPEHAILDEIYKRKDIFQLMYSEVKGDTSLVDGIPRDVEETFSHDYYYSNNDNDSEDYDYNAGYNGNKTNEYGEFNQPDQSRISLQNKDSNNQFGGFVCRSEVMYGKPKLARNLKGKWKVIVNAGDFTQTLRMEKCIKPNSECRFIADHKYESRCAQISSIHRLLVFEKGKGFYIETFRIPTACTCHVFSSKQDSNKHNSYYSGQSSSISVRKNKPKSNLGQTLWSLLGTNSPQVDSKQNYNGKNNMLLNSDSQNLPNSLSNNDIELLKLLPQISTIGPENVLQQLLDGLIEMDMLYSNSPTFPKSHLPKSPNYPLLDDYDREANHKYQKSFIRQNGMQTEGGSHDIPSMLFNKQRTSTIVKPMNGGQSPLVQVIHVPVSGGILTTGEEEQNNQQEYFGHNRFTPLYPSRNANKDFYMNGSKYLVSASTNQLRSQSNDTMEGTTSPVAADRQVDSGENHSESKSTPIENTQSTSKKSTEPNKDIQKILDKKINFSYHPILDYIVN